MGHYDECVAVIREQERINRRLELEEVLSDLREGNRQLHPTMDEVRRRSRVARAKELVENAIDLVRLEICELNDGFLKR